MKFKVTSKQAGSRFDVVLTEKLKLTRSQIQKQIKAGLYMVDREPTAPHYILKMGEMIEGVKTDNTKPEAIIEPQAIPEYKIVAETKDYLVVHKPVGLLMHGTATMREANLADLLSAKYPEMKKVGDDPFRPGIIHRIDKDVSGLVLVAKTQAFFESAKEQFQTRTIQKNYLALVHGVIQGDEGIIDFPIKRATSGHKMAALPKGADGRVAISEFVVTKRFLHYTLVKVAIKTGRTHQIRAHMAAYGHPIVGDNLYGTKICKDQNRRLHTKRVFLVAQELSFTDLAGERKEFTLSIPEDFIELTKNFK